MAPRSPSPSTLTVAEIYDQLDAPLIGQFLVRLFTDRYFCGETDWSLPPPRDRHHSRIRGLHVRSMICRCCL